MRIISGKYKGRAINRPATSERVRRLTSPRRTSSTCWETSWISRSATYWTSSPGPARSATSSPRGEPAASRPWRSTRCTTTSSGRRPRNWASAASTPSRRNAFLYLKNCNKQFDIVFSDAPYDLEGSEEIVRLTLEGDRLRSGGLLIFEHSKKVDFSDNACFWQLRSYGSVQFSFFKNRKKHCRFKKFDYLCTRNTEKRCVSSAG